jgi:hypothetical protein
MRTVDQARHQICSPEPDEIGIFGSMALPDGVDTEKLAQVALALLSLTSFTDHGQIRAWKGLDWDLLDLLHERGWIYDPKGKARSVVLTEAGHRLSEEAFARHFTQTASVERSG